MSADDVNALDALSADELIASALAEKWDSDARWVFIREMHRRGDRDCYETAMELVESRDPEERELAVDVLAKLGERDNEEDRPFREHTIDFLIELIARERAPRVLSSATTALGHLHSERAIAPVAALSRHPDSGVRMGVVRGLLGHEDPLAISTLIELTTDEDEEIRDWATFGIGTQVEADTNEIRDALASRLDDPHEDTAAEGIAGLAFRGDARAMEPLLGLLETVEGSLVDDAVAAMAAHTGDERLRPHLEALWIKDGAKVLDDHPLRLAARRYGLSEPTADASTR